MFLRDQIAFTYRSNGVFGLARAIVRKAFHRLLVFERFHVLEAAAPPRAFRDR